MLCSLRIEVASIILQSNFNVNFKITSKSLQRYFNAASKSLQRDFVTKKAAVCARAERIPNTRGHMMNPKV